MLESAFYLVRDAMSCKCRCGGRASYRAGQIVVNHGCTHALKGGTEHSIH